MWLNHHIIIERLLCWILETARTSLIKEDTVVLRARLALCRVILLLEAITMRLLTQESTIVIHLALDLHSLFTWHELLCMLIWISKLTATLVIEIFLWAHISALLLTEARMSIRTLT